MKSVPALDDGVLYINGYGFPEVTGGPMFWADLQGLDTVVARLELEEPGGEVTFTVLVEDVTGAESLTLTALADSLVGDLDGRGTCEVPVRQVLLRCIEHPA